MSITLRRELKNTIQKVIEEQEDKLWSIGSYNDGGMDAEGLASVIAEAVMEMRAFKPKEAFDHRQADPAWDIIYGKRKQEDVDHENVRLAAFAEFERALQLPDSWYWNSSGPEEKSLAVLRSFVIETYKQDKLAFQKYQTWRTGPFARGAMSNVSIKRDPAQFVYSWSDYQATTGTNVVRSNSVDVDDNDTPISY